jgi:hypothetical protein
LFIIIFCLSGKNILAQDLSNLRAKKLILQADTTQIDSLSIIEEGFSLKYRNGNIVSSDNYELLSVQGKLIWKTEFPADSLIFEYRVYPFLFTKKVFNRSYQGFKEKTESEGFLIDASPSKGKTTTSELIDFGKLTYSGNFSRGVSFGNAQSLNLNSNFNIQLSGMITDDIEVRAAITDNNIPIQPEGNTAQLQEFDKVYIQLRKDKHFLTVGDFDLLSPSSYFMKFQRNLQGISYQGTQSIEGIGELSAMGSFSVSRGQFVINNLEAQEGNQGPYRLSGPNGEAFIIVLAGSERVFINGELAQRGANNDYVIDYNLGEIVFTPNRLITQDLRIRVEFEYGDRYYFRSLAHANVTFDHKKFTTRINFFSQQDAKNQPINQELDEAREDALISAGDDISNAFFPGISLTEFSETRVLYQKIDTTYNNITDTIYVYSTNPELAVYSLTFSFVGEGNGNYVPAQSVANGRVFEWVQPFADGSKRGSYEPLVLLVAPQKSQMLTTALDYKLSKNTIISGEFALSNYDLNTFSPLDSDDNKGVGINLQFQDLRKLKSDSLKQVKVLGSYEFKQKTFTPIERYRAVEFNRNWNLPDEEQRNENLGNAGVEFLKLGKGRVGYNFSFLQRDSVYNGFENTFYANYNYNGWILNTNTIWLESKGLTQKSQFIRPRLSAQKAISALNDWAIGFTLNNEINKQQDIATDSLLPTSFLWQEYGVFIQNPDTARSMYRFEYKLRYQHLSDGETSFDTPYIRANTFDFKGRAMGKKNHILNYNLVYRRLEQDTLFSANDDLKNFYLGRLDYSFNAYKGAVRGSSLYEIGAGREQQIQYNYIEAPDGQGAYAWRDLNENGVQEINEFFISAFTNENRFIRIATSTSEFIPVTTTRFNQSLNLNPKSVWFNEKGVRGFIARFSTTTALQFSKKVFASSAVSVGEVFNPVIFTIDDSLLVSSNTSIRNVVFFNRTNTKYGFEYNFNQNDSKTLLTSGFERRGNQTHMLKSRWNFAKTFTLNNQLTTGFRKNDSDFFFERKYQYLLNEALANITWLYKSVLRLEMTYNYAFRTNPLPETGGQFAVINQLSALAKYSIAGKSNLNVQFSYATVGYEDGGRRNEQLEFDMLQGYLNGNNYLWIASFDKTIMKNLQLSLVYEGRKTGIDEPVHTGRAQVRAIF